MKIVESRKTRLAGGMRSSVKPAVLVGHQPIDLSSIELQHAPRPGGDARRGEPAAGFRQVPFERGAENLAHLLALPDRLQLDPAEQVFIQQRADLLAAHFMTLS